MAKKDKLSPRQESILAYIWDYMNEHKRPPTIREIGRAVKISSTSVVNYNLNKLTEKGLVKREQEVSRGINLTEKGMGLLGKVQTAVASAADAVVDRFIRIPMVGDIVASEPLEVGHDGFAAFDDEDALEISATMLPDRLKIDNLFALRVNGDSMIDAMVADGDIVIMKQQAEARNGDMVAVWLPNDGTTTLKYFHNEGSRVRLQPANPTMDPIYVDPTNVQVQGKVVMVVRQTP